MEVGRVGSIKRRRLEQEYLRSEEPGVRSQTFARMLMSAVSKAFTPIFGFFRSDVESTESELTVRKRPFAEISSMSIDRPSTSTVSNSKSNTLLPSSSLANHDILNGEESVKRDVSPSVNAASVSNGRESLVQRQFAEKDDDDVVFLHETAQLPFKSNQSISQARKAQRLLAGKDDYDIVFLHDTDNGISQENRIVCVEEQDDDDVIALENPSSHEDGSIVSNRCSQSVISYDSDSPSPQPEHSISRTASPCLYYSTPLRKVDKWKRRRLKDLPWKIHSLHETNRFTGDEFRRKIKNFLSENSLDTRVINLKAREQYRELLSSFGAKSVQFSGNTSRFSSSSCGKQLETAEVLCRGHAALNRISNDCKISRISPTPSTSKDHDEERKKVAEKTNWSSVIGQISPKTPQDESSESRADYIHAKLEAEEAGSNYIQHRLRAHHETISFRKRIAESLFLEKKLREEGRRDEEICLEEQLRRKLVLTGYIFRDKAAKRIDEFIELPSDASNVIEKAWNLSLPLDEKLTEEVMRKDLLTLKGLEWLNDEIINYYLKLICERSSDYTSLPKAYAFTTFFYTSLSNKGYQSVRRWTRKIDLFTYDLIFVPIHLGAHWCLAVIDFERKTIEYYDSMQGSNDCCLKILSMYLKNESLDKKKRTFDFDNWKLVTRKDIPQQMNGSDCGMFACKFADFISRRVEISFTQENMPYYRRRMVYEICQKKLL